MPARSARRGREVPLYVEDPKDAGLAELHLYLLSDDGVGIANSTLPGRATAAAAPPCLSATARGQMSTAGRRGTGPDVARAARQQQGRYRFLPERAYNAWTQPIDADSSCHGPFGNEPYLAYLYRVAAKSAPTAEHLAELPATAAGQGRIAALQRGTPRSRHSTIPRSSSSPTGATTPWHQLSPDLCFAAH